MKFVRLADRNMKEVYRDPVSMLLGLVLPLVMLLLFTSINKRQPMEMFSPQHLVPGVVIFGMAFTIMFSAMLLSKDKKNAFLIRLFTTPLKASDYIISYMAPFLPFALMQTAVVFVVGAFLGAVYQNLLFVVLVILLTELICVSLGLILGSLLTENQVAGAGALLVTMIGLFCGAWMDLHMVGGIFEKVGYAIPFAHAVDASRAALSGLAFAEYSRSFFIVLIYAVVLFVLSIFAFKRAMKKP
ncbi:MAG: ABC transporter permease [Candidatus Marinimicrobia bacterium]|nr:ABC transporter permease [Candidatus Neomarinimicrobiota bacterium]